MEKVTISRKWNNPEITTKIDSEEISLSISLDNFIEALIQEIGSVATTFTQKAFNDKVKSAKEKVIFGIKEESLKVIKIKGE